MKMKNKLKIIFVLTLIYCNPIFSQNTVFSSKKLNQIKLILESNSDSAGYIKSSIDSIKNTKPYYYLIGIYNHQLKDYINSNLYLNKLVKNYDISSIDYSDVYHFLGVNYFYLNNSDSSLYFLKKEIQLEKELNIIIKTPHANRNIAILFNKSNEKDSSIYYNKLALSQFQKLKDQAGIASVYNSFGNLYQDFDYHTAVEYYTKALKFYEALKYEKNIAIIQHNLGLLFINLEKYRLAIEYFESSHQYFLDNNFNYYSIICLNNIGFAQLQLNDLKPASIALNKAISINTEYNDALTFSYLNLGVLNEKQKNFKTAKDYFLKSLAIAKENKLTSLLKEIYSNLVLISNELNNSQDLLLYFENFKNVILEESNANYAKELAKYEKQYRLKEANHLLNLAIKDQKISEQKNIQHKIEISKKNNLLILGSLAIFLLIAIIIVIINSNRKIKNLNSQLDLRNKKIIQQKITIENHNKVLETKIEERTKELVIAKKKAEESNLLKSTFLANISHEIRTPLNSIMGFSDFLTSPETTLEEVSKYGGIIRNNGFELLNFINDLIDVSKIESDQFNLSYSEVSYDDFIKTIECDNYEKPKYFGKVSDIDFITSFSELTAKIYTDPLKLEMVFDKLINNAFQFTDKGFVEIGSEIIGNKIRFYVSDSGIGIPKERLNQILENFRKFRKDQHLRYRGLGVGLFIANHILKKMGSELIVDSTENKGSKFSFELSFIDE